MKLRLPSKKFILGGLSILVAIAILMTVIPAAAAGGNNPITPIPGLGRLPDNTLIMMHKKLGGWYSDQESLLREANQLSQTFQTLIDSQSKQGKDVSILNDAMAIFNSELTASQEIHLVAGGFIYSLTGFMVNGEVRDRLAAGAQLLDGFASLRDAHFRLTRAMDALRKSFANWRQYRIVNPSWIPTPGPTATP